MTLAAGTLNTLVNIEKRGRSSDELNQPYDNWALQKAVWADIRGSSGLGVIKQSDGVTKSIARYSIRIRYSPTGIDVGMRVNNKGEIYSIVQIQHDKAKREWTDLVCEIGGNDG